MEQVNMKKCHSKNVTTVIASWLVLSFLVMGSAHIQAKKKREKKMAENNKYYLTTGLMLRKVVEIPASADEVFEAWTTDKGVETFFTPKGKVELAIHGKYEMYFDDSQPEGLKGSEGCEILSFVPGEVLSFTWNAPPSMPEVRKERTWVVIRLQPLEAKKTRVSLIHLGWQAGEQWQQALKYFDRAWDVVLGRLIYRFQNKAIDWKNPFTPGK
jgi:uncharacterized protein YndB with AHSA1/START domain